MLTDDDLAYMRETQAEARPTAAVLFRRVAVRTASGGTQTTHGTSGEPVQVRLDGTPDAVPTEVADRLQGATAVKVVLDQARDVRSLDRLQVSPVEVYEIVSDGDPDRWATAQVVWARRVVFVSR